MKRNFLHTLALAVLAVVAMLAATSCRKSRIIPDSTLSKIFYEAFLTNAYLSEKNPVTDSMALYEPIFEKYGYTVEDLQYTIGNFSKRKSARLGNVVEVAIARLEAEGLYLDREVTILDTIDARARRRYSRTLLSDSLVKVYRLADTTRLKIVIDSLQRGDYEVSFSYNIDSLDKNGRMRAYIRTERENGSEYIETNVVMQRRTDRKISHTVRNDGSLRRLKISLAEFEPNSKRQAPHITFRNVRVHFVPYADDVVDSLYEQTINMGVFNMGLLDDIRTAASREPESADDNTSADDNATDSLP